MQQVGKGRKGGGKIRLTYLKRERVKQSRWTVVNKSKKKKSLITHRYDPKKNKDAKAGSAESAKAELDRYLHYYQRYHNHDQSKKVGIPPSPPHPQPLPHHIIPL